MRKAKVAFLFLTAILIFTGCVKDETSIIQEVETEIDEIIVDEETKQEGNQKNEIDYERIKPNEVGDILVIMYHGLVQDNPPSIWQRSIKDFKKDLNYMYKNGYRPISMQDYLDFNIDVEAGFTPIVLTFDDSLSSTFSLREESGKYVPNIDTAVDIMNKFSEDHPDFGKAAVFFMNGNPFMRDTITEHKGEGKVKDRLEYLLSQGYELGNHTWTHPKLNKLDKQEVQEEMGEISKMVKESLPNATIDLFSYPFGIRPKEDLYGLIESGQYEGVDYVHRAAVREAPRAPYFVPAIHKDFEAFNIPRTVGSEGSQMDLWWYFNYYEENPQKRFISDGDTDKISIPKELEEEIDQNKIGNKELVIYNLEG